MTDTHKQSMLTLNETFAVPDSEQAWRAINDLETLVTCVPGARVASVDGPHAVRAEIDVRMGAMGMTFTGPVQIESSDAAGRTVAIKANTRETLGQSHATGDITISVDGGDVKIVAVANVGGKAAGMGEGVIVSVLTNLVRSFSANLAGAVGEHANGARPAPPAPPAPVDAAAPPGEQPVAAPAREVQAVSFAENALERMRRFTSPAEGDAALGGTRAARTATGEDSTAIFSSVTRILSGRLDVTTTTGPGGGPLLKARGQSFAMLHGDELVVRLHPLRCADLIQEGRGRLLELDGSTLEDWFVVGGSDASEWSARAKEALAGACG
jgi:carbon monoxide dehydrogenase subunit G